MEVIEISTESINLAQLLKWANVVASGAEAKHLIQDGRVKLNGHVELRRAKKIYPEDIISIGQREFKVSLG